MKEFAWYLSFFMDWVLGPILFVIAIMLHMKFRKLYTLLMAIGVGLLIIAQVIGLYKLAPLHPANLIALGLEFVGLVVGIYGFFQYIRKHYLPLKNSSSFEKKNRCQ